MQFWNNFFSSSEKSESPPPSSTEEPAREKDNDSLDGGTEQRNAVGMLPQHAVADEHLSSVGKAVQEKYKDDPAVVDLSKKMEADRIEYSNDHPEASGKDVLHAMQQRDSAAQMQAASDGVITPRQVTELAADSTGPFLSSLLDPDKRPETLDQVGDALVAAVTGLGNQMVHGTIPGGEKGPGED